MRRPVAPVEINGQRVTHIPSRLGRRPVHRHVPRRRIYCDCAIGHRLPGRRQRRRSDRFRPPGVRRRRRRKLLSVSDVTTQSPAGGL